jgi:ABC-type multidrug transport system fused ATPase/permease subunit
MGFTALTLFNLLRFPLNCFPDMINFLVRTRVSLRRIHGFLCTPDVKGLTDACSDTGAFSSAAVAAAAAASAASAGGVAGSLTSDASTVAAAAAATGAISASESIETFNVLHRQLFADHEFAPRSYVPYKRPRALFGSQEVPAAAASAAGLVVLRGLTLAWAPTLKEEADEDPAHGGGGGSGGGGGGGNRSSSSSSSSCMEAQFMQCAACIDEGLGYSSDAGAAASSSSSSSSASGAAGQRSGGTCFMFCCCHHRRHSPNGSAATTLGGIQLAGGTANVSGSSVGSPTNGPRGRRLSADVDQSVTYQLLDHSDAPHSAASDLDAFGVATADQHNSSSSSSSGASNFTELDSANRLSSLPFSYSSNSSTDTGTGTDTALSSSSAPSAARFSLAVPPMMREVSDGSSHGSSHGVGGAAAELGLGLGLGLVGEDGSRLDNVTVILENTSFVVPRGSLAVVVGITGAGKSSLLQGALLGEALHLAGQAAVGGSVSYAPQSPWIQNATLRDNILFGTPYDKER